MPANSLTVVYLLAAAICLGTASPGPTIDHILSSVPIPPWLIRTTSGTLAALFLWLALVR